MKRLHTIILILLLAVNTNGQNVYIPDANFKAALVGDTLINTNKDSEIQSSEALAYKGSIDVHGLGIINLEGIRAFNSIAQLDCSFNSLINLDVSSNFE